MQTFLRVVVIVCLAGGAVAQQPVRLSWQEFEKDPRRVQSLRNAIATMKARNSADPSTATSPQGSTASRSPPTSSTSRQLRTIASPRDHRRAIALRSPLHSPSNSFCCPPEDLT